MEGQRMKKKYIKPAFEAIAIANVSMLSGSTDQTGWENQLAPEMMNLPEENEQTEYEE